MKITISELNGLQDGLLAAGLTAWLGQIDGVTVDAPAAMLPLQMQPVARPEAPETKCPNCKLPVAGHQPCGSFAAAKSKPAKSTTPAKSANLPRVTIRSRIVSFIKAHPGKNAREIFDGLVREGMNADYGLIGQHLWTIRRDGLAVRDDDERWSAAA